MKTTVIAGEIANYTIDQLKKHVMAIEQLNVLEQERVRDIIRDSALEILNKIAAKGFSPRKS